MPWWAWLALGLWILSGLGALEHAGVGWKEFLSLEPEELPYVVGCLVMGLLAWAFVW